MILVLRVVVFFHKGQKIIGYLLHITETFFILMELGRVVTMSVIIRIDILTDE